MQIMINLSPGGTDDIDESSFYQRGNHTPHTSGDPSTRNAEPNHIVFIYHPSKESCTSIDIPGLK